MSISNYTRFIKKIKKIIYYGIFTPVLCSEVNQSGPKRSSDIFGFDIVQDIKTTQQTAISPVANALVKLAALMLVIVGCPVKDQRFKN